MNKECTLCHTTKNIDEFYRINHENVMKYLARCKACVRQIRNIKYRENHSKKINKINIMKSLNETQIEEINKILEDKSMKKTDISKKYNICYTDLMNYCKQKIIIPKKVEILH